MVKTHLNNISKWRLPTQPAVQKTKDSSFTVINDKEKQKILKFKKLEPANLW